MNCYVDSSIVLAMILGEKQQLRQYSKITVAHASQLLLIECERTFDRIRLGNWADDDIRASLREKMNQVAETLQVHPLHSEILRRAAGSFPTVVGTLDAIHLATALQVQAALLEPLVFATHDHQLGRAARACGLAVIGIA